MITPLFLIAYSAGEVREKTSLSCAKFCNEKDMTYFDYDTLIGRTDVFCECLNNGTMKKFALVSEEEQ
jgi:hypothetical protein